MAIVTVKFDLDTKKYNISSLDAGSVHDPMGDINYDDLYVLFGFTRGETKPVEFNNLKFGFNLRDMETKKIVSSIAYPLIGIQYMRSDADILEHTKVSVIPGKQYRLDFWVQNNYEETKGYAWFVIPIYSDYELDYNTTHDDSYQEFLTMKDDTLDGTVY
jgi:hypothetical protein